MWPTTLRLTRHARRDEEEGPAGVSGKKMRERSTFDSFQSRGDIRNVSKNHVTVTATVKL